MIVLKLSGYSAVWGLKPLPDFTIYSLPKPVYFGDGNNDSFPEIIIDSIPVPYFISDTRKLDIARSMLINRTKKLVNFGVDVIAIACNTAHLLYPELSQINGANFISMIDCVNDQIRYKKLKRVGLLATPTTIKMKLYGCSFCDLFVLPIIDQKKYERIIRNIVAGKTNLEQIEYLYQSTNEFIEKFNLDGIILGCTELPLIFPKNKFSIPILDSLDILAESLVNYNVKI
jgi:aspartate racemase